MKTIVKKAVCIFLCAGAFAVAEAKTVYRDSLGRRQGSSEVDRNGKVTYRDSLGRKRGTAETDRYGKTTFRDSLGNRLPFPSSGDLPGSGVKPTFPALAGGFLTTAPSGKPKYLLYMFAIIIVFAFKKVD